MYHVLPLRKYLSKTGDYPVGEKCCHAGNYWKIFVKRTVTLLPCRFAVQPLWGCHSWQVMLILGVLVNDEIQTIILLIYFSSACTRKVQAVYLTISVPCSLEKLSLSNLKLIQTISTFIKPLIFQKIFIFQKIIHHKHSLLLANW